MTDDGEWSDWSTIDPETQPVWDRIARLNLPSDVMTRVEVLPGGQPTIHLGTPDDVPVDVARLLGREGFLLWLFAMKPLSLHEVPIREFRHALVSGLPGTLGGLDVLESCVELRSLRIPVELDTVIDLSRLPHLESVELVGEAGLSALRNPNVRRAHLETTTVPRGLVITAPLRSLSLRCGPRLRALPPLSAPAELKVLLVVGSTTFDVSSLTRLTSLESARFVRCRALTSIDTLARLDSLRDLWIIGARSSTGRVDALLDLELDELDVDPNPLFDDDFQREFSRRHGTSPPRQITFAPYQPPAPGWRAPRLDVVEGGIEIREFGSLDAADGAGVADDVRHLVGRIAADLRLSVMSLDSESEVVFLDVPEAETETVVHALRRELASRRSVAKWRRRRSGDG